MQTRLRQKTGLRCPGSHWKSAEMLALLDLHFDPTYSLISKYFFSFMVGTEVLNVAVLVAFFFLSSTVNRKPGKYTLL